MITRKYLLVLLGGLLSFAIIISCSEDKTSSSYEVHPDGWMDRDSEVFHGGAAITTGSESCLDCHATAQPGATATGNGAVSCYNCHSLYPHIWESRVRGHRDLIHDLNWDLNACSECHGADFAGGTYAANCLACHTGDRAFTNCNLCHATPPVDDAGLPAGFADGAFGAHAVHSRYACTECHATVTNLTHVDGIPAEVNFVDAEIADRNGHLPTYAPSLDPGAGSGGCGSIYCHGDAAVNWRGDPVSCGSCHQIPPATVVHTGANQCHLCHPNVDPASNYETPEGIFFVAGMEASHVDGVATVIFPFE